MRIHQLLYGYNQGHQLLSGSTTIDSPKDNLLLTRLTDWSGFIPSVDKNEPYMASTYLPGCQAYAVCLTWYAYEMDRSGCVWSHVLLLDVDEIFPDFNFIQLLNYFHRPNKDDYQSYSEVIVCESAENCIGKDFASWNKGVVILFYGLLLSGTGVPILEDREQAKYHFLALSLLNNVPIEILKKTSICTGYTRQLEQTGVNFGMRITNGLDAFSLNNMPIEFKSIYDKIPDGIKYIGDSIYKQDIQLYPLIRVFSSDIGSDLQKLHALGSLVAIVSNDDPEEVNSKISIVFAILSLYFPKYNEGIGIKNSFLSKDFTSLYTSEKNFFFELSTSKPIVRYDSKTNVLNRLKEYMHSDEESFIKLIEILLSDDYYLNSYGRLLISYSFTLAGKDRYNNLVHKNWGRIKPIILRDKQIISSCRWIKLFPTEVKSIVLELNIEQLKTIVQWRNLIPILDEPDFIINKELRQVINGIKEDWISPLLNRHNVNSDKATQLLELALEHEQTVVKWIGMQYEIAPSLKIMISKSLNPNSAYIKLMGEDIWFHFSDWDSNPISLVFNIFKFKLGFNWGNGLAIGYIRESFFILHEKLKDERYNNYIWQMLGSFCNDVTGVITWDKCAVLRKKVARHFIEANIPSSFFKTFTPDKGLNALLIKAYEKMKKKK